MKFICTFQHIHGYDAQRANFYFLNKEKFGNEKKIWAEFKREK
jgi:hypothetical protein